MSATGLQKALIGAAVPLCASLIALDAAAFRTASDTEEFATAGAVRWQDPVIPIVLQADGAPDLPAGQIEPVLQEALAAWNRTQCGQLFLDYQGVSAEHAHSGDSLNTIEWVTFDWAGRGFSPDKAAMTEVQYEQLPSGQWVIAEADVYLNAERYGWTSGAVDLPGIESIRSVLTHELGHLAGLLHVCEVGAVDGAPDCSTWSAFEGSIMYPEYSALRTALSDDDERGVCFLYPGARCELIGCPVGSTCTEAGCAQSCGSTVCAVGQQCVDDACVESALARGPDAQTAAECVSDADCTNGRCLEGVCQLIGETDFGVTCATASDCATGLCLADLTDEPVCTRPCGEGYAACAYGWSCEELGDAKVCTPRTIAPGGGGCEVSSNGANPSAWLGVAASGLVFSWVQRRRLRRANPSVDREMVKS